MATKNIAQCHLGRPHFARGLCKSCYRYHSKAGTLHRYPRLTIADGDFAIRYVEMRAAGRSRAELAEQLGMDRHAVDQAYYRAVRLGQIEPDAPRVSCGTRSGYQAHWRRREQACQACKEARAAAERSSGVNRRARAAS